jgi:basic amino acid/polyamine antiporter, APA family
VPLLFILVAVWLLLNTVMHSPLRSLLGLSLIALGLPVYFAIRRRQKTTPATRPPEAEVSG